MHKRRGQVSIDLYSPAKTRSQMLSTRKYDDSDEGLDEWNFMTVHKWGKFLLYKDLDGKPVALTLSDTNCYIFI